MYPPFHILLADDDEDDRFFFDRALKTVPIETQLTTVEDGERLMEYLSKSTALPDALFLDMNMPKMNGLECLKEIKASATLQNLPVIICSTALHEELANLLYKHGAHYFIRKENIDELEKALSIILTLLVDKNLGLPTRNDFILSVK
jgi:CheY-like chemotaxis protein